MDIASALKSVPDVEVRLDEPLSRHTTFRVGGPVRCLARPRTERALCLLLDEVRQRGIPFVLLGGGSNVLAPDGHWNAAVVQLRPAFTKLARLEQTAGEEIFLYAGAGAGLQRLVRYCIADDLEGIESLAGIPGTVGGALVMNAGTGAGSISDSLDWVDLIDCGGGRRRVPKEGLAPGYRTMGLTAGSIVLGGCFKLRKSSGELPRRRAESLIAHRRRTQPLRHPSAGSIFKNPPGHFAGALIEKAGLKGYRIGGAEISRKHANWIVNRGGALARDIVGLIEMMEKEILQTFGVRLEREIRILDQP